MFYKILRSAAWLARYSGGSNFILWFIPTAIYIISCLLPIGIFSLEYNIIYWIIYTILTGLYFLFYALAVFAYTKTWI